MSKSHIFYQTKQSENIPKFLSNQKNHLIKRFETRTCFRSRTKTEMSNSYLETCINFPLENQVLLDVVEKAKDWALMHGAGLRSKASFNPDVMQVWLGALM